jgi:N utilization substance protein B
MSSQDTLIYAQQLPEKDARSLVFHLLYAMDCFDYEVSLESVADNLSRGFDLVINYDDAVFVTAAVIIAERDVIDAAIKPLLANWRFDRVGVCTRLILRLALWELMQGKIQHPIVINEAVELAKCFAEMDAYKFVNGVLDEWVKKNN